ncbi:hypothetical protein RND81_06G193500 [Saponaria officinalis]|uniref:Retrotransposon gag domain-containing protein n=1 Tax=Saponaria officinalis TaxID=3572 RepID=A0AAW1K877_SAPOF
MANEELEQEVLRLKTQMEAMIQNVATLSLQVNDRAGGNRGNNLVRSPTIKFPIFNGEDVDSWMFKCEQFFSVTEIAANMKVTYASMHLESKALAWHQAFVKGRAVGEPLQSEEYSRAIKARFGDTSEDPMSELLSLKQTESVQAYHDAFNILLSKFDLQSTYALSCFLSGLDEKISVMVRMLKPQTIQEAFGLAKLQEAALNLHPKPTFKQPFHTSKSPIFAIKTPIFPTKTQNTHPQNTPPRPNFTNPYNPTKQTYPTTSNSPKLRLTSAEVVERRNKGLCFTCDERYTAQHVCKNRRQVFTMEAGEIHELDAEEEELEGDEQDTGECAQISVYALAGQLHCQTMRVQAQLGKRVLSVLVDSGSSHNFIDMGVVKRLELSLESIPTFQISVANGGKLLCSLIAHIFRQFKAIF